MFDELIMLFGEEFFNEIVNKSFTENEHEDETGILTTFA